MKNFLVLIIGLILLSSFSVAQVNGLIMTSKVITWSDSLGYSGSDTLSVADSSAIIPINYRADYFRIFLDANANSPVDSIAIKLGARVYNNSGTCTDTTWSDVIAVKDSSMGTPIVTMVNSATGKSYSIWNLPPYDLMKIYLLNHRATLLTRNTRFTLQGTKD